nr:threonylcarbamoyl-AMP synthase [Desulfobulbaceae bacterium]
MGSAVLSDGCLPETIIRAAAVIQAGGVVAFPTETYYGLAVDPFNDEALQRLFEIKKRPFCKPILVLINTYKQLPLLVDSIPVQYQNIMEQFWPGPLTLIFPAKAGVSTILTGNTDTVGVRISSNPVAQRLVASTGIPITATSANLSGENPASSPSEVRQQFGEQLDMIIDGGMTRGGCGSTIVGFAAKSLQIIRAGVISASRLGI